jgi:hypothetical protein
MANAWRDVYTPRQLAMFDERYGQLVEAFGYDRN